MLFLRKSVVLFVTTIVCGTDPVTGFSRDITCRRNHHPAARATLSAPYSWGQVACSTSAFRTSSATALSSSEEEEAPADGGGGDLLDRRPDPDYVRRVVDNTLGGEVGTRGEPYVLAQAVLVLCIVGGGVPLGLGDALTEVGGPLLLVVGVLTIASGLVELGPALSPWPVPVDGDDDARLVTTGAFAFVRHPIYCGLLCACAGLGLWTGSALRLLLTALLFYVLASKSDFEEAALAKQWPAEYAAYAAEVPGKIFPDLLSLLSSAGDRVAP